LGIGSSRLGGSIEVCRVEFVETKSCHAPQSAIPVGARLLEMRAETAAGPPCDEMSVEAFLPPRPARQANIPQRRRRGRRCGVLASMANDAFGAPLLGCRGLSRKTHGMRPRKLAPPGRGQQRTRRSAKGNPSDPKAGGEHDGLRRGGRNGGQRRFKVPGSIRWAAFVRPRCERLVCLGRLPLAIG